MFGFSCVSCLLLAVLVVSASGAAQIGIDVSGAGGGVPTAMPAAPLINDATAFGAVSVAVTPGLPRGVRLVASAMYGPGDDSRREEQVAALGVGVEVPFSGGRNGVYVALGGALLDFDNGDSSGCTLDLGCMDESGSLSSYTGPTATVGLGARIPVVQRFWIEPAISAFISEAPLPSARIGVGWRVR